MLSIDGRTIAIEKELEIIFKRCVCEIRSIDLAFSQLYIEKMNKLKQRDILVSLPYWLTESMHCPHPLNVIRSLVLGNLLGTSHLMILDRIIDGQSDLLTESNNAHLLLISNLLYYKGITEYQRVFPAYSRFWLLFEKYLHEYTHCTLWEKHQHWGKLKDFEENDFKYLGQKLSPLKISGAGMCLLSDRTEWIPFISEFIEQYHIGYQLADDVNDWREDLHNRNYTYYLTKIHMSASASTLSEKEIDDILLTSDITNEVIERSTFYYLKARAIAEQLSCKQLYTYVNEVIQRNEKKLSKNNFTPAHSTDLSESPLDIDRPLCISDVHYFENNGHYFIFDVNRHLVFTIDLSALEVLQFIHSKKESTLRSIFQNMTMVPSDDVTTIVKELMKVHVIQPVDQYRELLPGTETPHELFSQRPYEQIVGLEMQISTRFPIRQVMKINRARNTIDLFFHNSGEINYKGKHTVFLSCACLGNEEVDVIQSVIEYSVQLGTRLMRTIHFVLNTPLAHLSYDSLLQCVKNDSISSVILIANHEDVFAFSQRADVNKILTILKDSQKPVSISLQYVENWETLKDAIERLRRLGFEAIFLQPSDTRQPSNDSITHDEAMVEYEIRHHFYFLNSLHAIPRAVKQNACRFHCNAGKAYLSVTTDGTILPCPRFIGHPEYSLGNVSSYSNINQRSFLKRDVRTMASCTECWARYICGGGCMFRSHRVTGSLDIPDAQWCIEYKKQVEHMIQRYYDMSPEKRNELDEARNLSIRFCDSW